MRRKKKRKKKKNHDDSDKSTILRFFNLLTLRSVNDISR